MLVIRIELKSSLIIIVCKNAITTSNAEKNFKLKRLAIEPDYMDCLSICHLRSVCNGKNVGLTALKAQHDPHCF